MIKKDGKENGSDVLGRENTEACGPYSAQIPQ